jgi:hypothetical protein
MVHRTHAPQIKGTKLARKIQSVIKQVDRKFFGSGDSIQTAQLRLPLHSESAQLPGIQSVRKSALAMV